jgi:hypothetical protein
MIPKSEGGVKSHTSPETDMEYVAGSVIGPSDPGWGNRVELTPGKKEETAEWKYKRGMKGESSCSEINVLLYQG